MTHQTNTSYPLTGLILAGGKSSRFQKAGSTWQDKALYEVAPQTSLLIQTIKTLSPFCKEIIIAVNDAIRKERYEEHLRLFDNRVPTTLTFVTDDKEIARSGPIRAILSAFPAVKTPSVLVVPVDMPLLSHGLLKDFIAAGQHQLLLFPFWRSCGKIEPLLFIAKPHALLPFIQVLRHYDSSRADDIIRLAPEVSFLPIDKAQEEHATKLFSSINKLTDLPPTLELLTASSETKSLFDLNSLLTFKIDINQSLLTNFQSFFELPHSSLLKEETILAAIQLAHALQKKRLFFHAALLLHLFLTVISHSELFSDQHVNSFLRAKIFESFYAETRFWVRRKIHFLAYHAAVDALAHLKRENLSSWFLKKKINKYRKQMALTKKNSHQMTFDAFLKKNLPNDFVSKVKTIIQEAEEQFNQKAPKFPTNFLWDHSFRVSKIAYKLAIAEGADPLIAILAALFHDSGKFVLGKYHEGNIAEEELSSSIANAILTEAGFSSTHIAAVLKAINALYNENLSCDIYCRILHDADRLEKLGSIGVANFFTKMALRGTNLSEALLSSLSRELTYALVAPKTMLTKSGKKFARPLSKKSFAFFTELLHELKEWGVGEFIVREVHPRERSKVVLVVPKNCINCKVGNYSLSLTTEQGIKCEKLVATFTCDQCSATYTVQFCLPLITHA